MPVRRHPAAASQCGKKKDNQKKKKKILRNRSLNTLRVEYRVCSFEKPTQRMKQHAARTRSNLGADGFVRAFSSGQNFFWRDGQALPDSLYMIFHCVEAPAEIVPRTRSCSLVM